MLKGIHLTLMIGPAMAVPVPRSVVESLVSIQVTSNTDAISGFQIQFSLARNSILEGLFLVSAGSAIPLIRVIIVVTINGQTQVLMDGVVTNTEIQPGENGGPSTLTVTGEDLSRVMDYIDFSGVPFPAMPDFVRIAGILAKYSFLGIIPLVIPPALSDVPNPLDRIPRQEGKDLEYIRKLADEVGYVFYLDPGPRPGVSTAYWGPEIKIGAPQSALNTNMDAHTNVESLSFSIDTEEKTTPVVWVQEPFTKAPIPIPMPDVSLLTPPLGAVPPIAKKMVQEKDTAKENVLRASAFSLTKASKSSEVVVGEGSLDVMRYGHVLKSRKLVGVRGAGVCFDGLYFVKTVTHNIKRGEYKQSFTLTRNGLVSTVPAVVA